MDSSKKDIENLEQVIAMGDEWLRRFGVVSPFAHNTIILNLRMKFPKIKNLEYLLDSEERKIELILHVPRGYLFWITLFGRSDRFIDEVMMFLGEYLHHYQITIKLTPYKGS